MCICSLWHLWPKQVQTLSLDQELAIPRMQWYRNFTWKVQNTGHNEELGPLIQAKIVMGWNNSCTNFFRIASNLKHQKQSKTKQKQKKQKQNQLFLSIMKVSQNIMLWLVPPQPSWLTLLKLLNYFKLPLSAKQVWLYLPPRAELVKVFCALEVRLWPWITTTSLANIIVISSSQPRLERKFC